MSDHEPTRLIPVDEARPLAYLAPFMKALHRQRTELAKERRTARRIVVPWEWPGKDFDGATLYGLPIQRRPGAAEPFVDALQDCPECMQGKHTNCNGITWDDAADEPTACPCGHQWAEVSR